MRDGRQNADEALEALQTDHQSGRLVRAGERGHVGYSAHDGDEDVVDAEALAVGREGDVEAGFGGGVVGGVGRDDGGGVEEGRWIGSGVQGPVGLRLLQTRRARAGRMVDDLHPSEHLALPRHLELRKLELPLRDHLVHAEAEGPQQEPRLYVAFALCGGDYHAYLWESVERVLCAVDDLGVPVYDCQFL